MLVHRIAFLVRARRENPRGILALAYNRHATAGAGRVENVAALLAAGADPNLADARGSTPLHWAAGNSSRAKGSIALVTRLARAGAE